MHLRHPAATRCRSLRPWWIRLLSAVALTHGLASPASAQVLLVSGFNSQNVERFDGATGAYLGDFIAAGAGGLNRPEGLGFTAGGSLLVNSFSGNQVIRYDGMTGAFQAVFAAITSPTGLVVRGNEVFVSSFSASGFVNRYDATTGALLGTFVAAGSGGLGSAHGLAFGPNGNLFVADSVNNDVLQYNGTTGAFVNVFTTGGGLTRPTAITFGPDGNLYVSSQNDNKVARFDGTTGASLGDFVGSGSGGLTAPHGLIFRGDGFLYAAGGSVVLRYNSTTGAFADQFATAPQLQGATYMTFAPVPEPSSVLLAVFGIAAGAIIRRRAGQTKQRAAKKCPAWKEGAPDSNPSPHLL